MTDFWNELTTAVEAAKAAGDTPAVVKHLHDARLLIDTEMNSRMADALIDGGVSIRSMAATVNLSENSLGPRLASTPQLSGYARADGRVTSSGIERARYDRERSSEPMKFTPRKAH